MDRSRWPHWKAGLSGILYSISGLLMYIYLFDVYYFNIISEIYFVSSIGILSGYYVGKRRRFYVGTSRHSSINSFLIGHLMTIYVILLVSRIGNIQKAMMISLSLSIYLTSSSNLVNESRNLQIWMKVIKNFSWIGIFLVTINRIFSTIPLYVGLFTRTSNLSHSYNSVTLTVFVIIILTNIFIKFVFLMNSRKKSIISNLIDYKIDIIANEIINEIKLSEREYDGSTERKSRLVHQSDMVVVGGFLGTIIGALAGPVGVIVGGTTGIILTYYIHG